MSASARGSVLESLGMGSVRKGYRRSWEAHQGGSWSWAWAWHWSWSWAAGVVPGSAAADAMSVCVCVCVCLQMCSHTHTHPPLSSPSPVLETNETSWRPAESLRSCKQKTPPRPPACAARCCYCALRTCSSMEVLSTINTHSSSSSTDSHTH